MFGPAIRPEEFIPLPEKAKKPEIFARPSFPKSFVPPPPIKTVQCRELADVDFEQTKPNALVTLVTGCTGKKIWFHAQQSFREAAARWNADLVIIQASGQPHVFCEKFRVRNMLDGERWDRIAYIDADCLISASAPSPFDLVPREKLGILPERHHYAKQPVPIWYDKELEEQIRYLGIETEQYPGEAYNAGVYVATACEEHRTILTPPPGPVPLHHCWEQNWMNWQIWLREVSIFRLPESWNFMFWPHKPEFLGKTASANVLHFAGMQNQTERIALMSEYAKMKPIASCNEVVL